MRNLFWYIETCALRITTLVIAVSAFSGELAFRESPVYGQVSVDKETARAWMLDVDERFSKVREKCCALMVCDITTDRPNLLGPKLTTVECIYASTDSGRTLRRDFGLGGNALLLTPEETWMWLRMLDKDGKHSRMTGTKDSPQRTKPEDLSKPTAFKLLDPLSLTVSNVGDAMSGETTADTMTNLAISCEIIEAKIDKDGDRFLTCFASSTMATIISIRFSKHNDYMPIEFSVTRNEDKTKSSKPKLGKPFSTTYSKWKRFGDFTLPVDILLKSKDDNPGEESVEWWIRTDWRMGDLDNKLLFDEATILERWDSVRSLGAALGEKK